MASGPHPLGTHMHKLHNTDYQHKYCYHGKAVLTSSGGKNMCGILTRTSE